MAVVGLRMMLNTEEKPLYIRRNSRKENFHLQAVLETGGMEMGRGGGGWGTGFDIMHVILKALASHYK